MAKRDPSKNPGGRPITGQEVATIFNACSHFATEKAMGDFIEENIRRFCSDVLEDDYLSHQREFNILPVGILGKRLRRMPGIGRPDFFITCKNRRFFVELKNPTHVLSELSKSIGQVLAYREAAEAVGMDVSLAIVTSKHDDTIDRLIQRYGLPIQYHVFNRDISAKLVANG